MIFNNAVAIAVNNQDVVKISIDGQLVWEKQYFGSISMQSTAGERQFSSLQEVREYVELHSDQLTTIALSGTPDASDTNMSGLFENCVNATSIDLSEFNPFLVNDVSNLFKGCSSLRAIDLCTFRTSSSTLTDGMFEGCTTVDLAYAKSQEDCDRLNASIGKEANVDFIVKPLQMSINDEPAEEYASLADARVVLKNRRLDLVSVIMSGCPSQTGNDFFQSFYDSPNLEKVNMLGLNADNLTIISGLCWKCSNLKEILLPDFRLGNLVEVNNLFEGCRSLGSLDLTNFDTRNVDMTSAMFNNCQSLKSIDLSRFNTSKTTYMDTMFSSCSSLTELDLSSFDLELVKKWANNAWSSLLSAFSGCTSVVKAYAKNQADCDFLNSNADKTKSPDNLIFTVKPV